MRLPFIDSGLLYRGVLSGMFDCINISNIVYNSPQWKDGLIRVVVSPEGDNLIVFYYLSVS
jgi:hypothetical protein